MNVEKTFNYAPSVEAQYGLESDSISELQRRVCYCCAANTFASVEVELNQIPDFGRQKHAWFIVTDSGMWGCLSLDRCRLHSTDCSHQYQFWDVQELPFWLFFLLSCLL